MAASASSGSPGDVAQQGLQAGAPEAPAPKRARVELYRLLAGVEKESAEPSAPGDGADANAAAAAEGDDGDDGDLQDEAGMENFPQNLLGGSTTMQAILSRAAVDRAHLRHDSALLQAPEEHLNWFKNAHLLYDIFIGYMLDRPALSVAWLPDVDGELPRLAVGMHNEVAGGSSEVIVLELQCVPQDRSDVNADEAWQIFNPNELGWTAECIGVEQVAGRSLLRPVAVLDHPTEVNRIAPCPYRPEIIATKAADGDVLLYDYKAECSQHPRRRLTRKRPRCEACTALPAGSSSQAWRDIPSLRRLRYPSGLVDGFALTWSAESAGQLATAGYDGQVCVWDVTAALRQGAPKSPLLTLSAHEGPCGDATYSTMQPNLLATVGDDGCLKIWDCRSAKVGPSDSTKWSDHDVQSVSWNSSRGEQLVTGGRPQDVRIWDLRMLNKPTHNLLGHTNEVVVVRWSPVKENLLCSASADCSVIVWDLQARNMPDDAEKDEDDNSSPELLFSHCGHFSKLADVSWNAQDGFLLCSVAEDDTLQIWQPSDFVTDPDPDDDDSDHRPEGGSED